MDQRMTCGTQRDQVLFRIFAALAAKFFVLHLQIHHAAAVLTSPAITPHHLLSELIVRFGIEPKPRPFGQYSVHEAFWISSCRKACRWSPGRNLKNREMDCKSTVGSSFSRFAPARKSAQIISRQ